MEVPPLYLVAIGSSAGGLPALRSLIKNLVFTKNTAYVIVQHLKIDQDSHLAEILQKDSMLPVREIEEGVSAEPDHIYVMPAGYKLRIENRIFILDRRPQSEVINTAINYFFTSAAADLTSQVFGVILSGTGSDGVEGVKEIERLGGIVIVQDPATAQFDGMPANTIHKDHPDYLVAPEEMGALLAELQQDRNSQVHTKRKYE